MWSCHELAWPVHKDDTRGTGPFHSQKLKPCWVESCLCVFGVIIRKFPCTIPHFLFHVVGFLVPGPPRASKRSAQVFCPARNPNVVCFGLPPSGAQETGKQFENGIPEWKSGRRKKNQTKDPMNSECEIFASGNMDQKRNLVLWRLSMAGVRHIWIWAWNVHYSNHG